jgi:hypothetical protein
MNDFVDIPGYPGYKLNRMGQVTGKQDCILKSEPIKGGYTHVAIYLNGKRKYMLTHRLVAVTFIPNPFNLPEVDHIDNNPANNCVDNLRWITSRDNLNRQERILNAKCYRQIGDSTWRVRYVIEDTRHARCFKHEDDAAFYVSLLKAIYPR